MPTHAEKRVLPYTAQQLYDLVAGVDQYPKFLPWCSAARVRSREPLPEGREQVDADLVISFKLFRERFGSRVTLDPGRLVIDVEYIDGPFRYLNNHWEFHDRPGEGRAEVDFYVDFEFKSRTLQSVVGLVFNEAMQRIVRAFEDRAADVYGAPEEASLAAPH
ncbi:MAG: type II toxin-antitoxin system RatA family toxin [Pseudomonadota bacterium]